MRVRTFLVRPIAAAVATLAYCVLLGACAPSVPGPPAGATVAPGTPGLHQVILQIQAEMPILRPVKESRYRPIAWVKVDGSQLVILSLDEAQLPGISTDNEQHFAQRLLAFAATQPVIPILVDIGGPNPLRLSYRLSLQTPQRIHVVIITNQHALMRADNPLVGTSYNPSTSLLNSETVSRLQPSGEIPLNRINAAGEMCQSLVYATITATSAASIKKVWAATHPPTKSLGKLYENEQLLGQEATCNTVARVLENGLYHVSWNLYLSLVGPDAGFKTKVISGHWPLTRQQFQFLNAA